MEFNGSGGMGTIEEADVVHHIKNGNGNHTGTEIPVVSWQWWIGMTKKEVVVWENGDIRIGVGRMKMMTVAGRHIRWIKYGYISRGMGNTDMDAAEEAQNRDDDNEKGIGKGKTEIADVSQLWILLVRHGYYVEGGDR